MKIEPTQIASPAPKGTFGSGASKAEPPRELVFRWADTEWRMIVEIGQDQIEITSVCPMVEVPAWRDARMTLAAKQVNDWMMFAGFLPKDFARRVARIWKGLEAIDPQGPARKLTNSLASFLQNHQVKS